MTEQRATIYHKKKPIITVNSYETATTWIAAVSQMSAFMGKPPRKYKIKEADKRSKEKMQ